MKKVLIVTYVFPPVGGAGVQRTLKWTKYLPEFGWEPFVLTCSNPSVPVFDEALEREIPKDLHIYRTRTFEPPYKVKRVAWGKAETSRGGLLQAAKKVAQRILIPDPQIGWWPTAYRKARQVIRNEEIDAVVTSAPPFSTHILGKRLRKRTGVPWLADFRDEWADFYTRAYDFHRRSGLAEKIFRMEREVIENSDALVTVTQGILENYRKRYPGVTSSNSYFIPNGFDEEDFSQKVSTPSGRESFRLTYSGTVFELTRATPFLDAVEIWLQKRPGAREHLRLRFVGRIAPSEQRDFDRPMLKNVLECTGYLPHSEALRQMRSSHVLLLFLSDIPGAERILTGKIFEYLAARRPILAVSPPSEATRLISQTEGGTSFAPLDLSGIAAELDRLYENWLQDKSFELPTRPGILQFSRRETTHQLAEVLSGLTTS